MATSAAGLCVELGVEPAAGQCSESAPGVSRIGKIGNRRTPRLEGRLIFFFRHPRVALPLGSLRHGVMRAAVCRIVLPHLLSQFAGESPFAHVTCYTVGFLQGEECLYPGVGSRIGTQLCDGPRAAGCAHAPSAF